MHGRFEPGTILAGRYRIVERLGQGGMGEVYRADDLKLAQPVALKFLPHSLEGDPARLAQFHNEVRLARQISHKNVCRMYDVGDADGLPFLTMEYVDGEDLASLLRRIGRLPEDKALDIARQLCSGIAAAHERGVLHRDLKPANVMIDGNGQVRITDFGLAAIAGGSDQTRAGTPAYMAPELLTGHDATVQSDVYALGLVLYEMFTGRRAYDAQTLAELLRQQNERAITPPTAVVKDLDPTIGRAILRAIERDPAQRPRSALAVAASLPGGDPLAAALAAGETPSPEMIDAAGERSGLKDRHAIVGAIIAVVLLTVSAATSEQHRVSNRLPLDLPPPVLVDRAHQTLEKLGYPPRGADRRWGFFAVDDVLSYAAKHPDEAARRDPFMTRPGAVQFYYRTSPRPLAPFNPVGAVTRQDPPLVLSGMTMVVLDGDGRLVAFHAIPPQKDPHPGATTAPAWATLFRLAGLDANAFQSVSPEWLPQGEADSRAAWEGAIEPGGPKVRLEAAAWRGRAVYFQIIGPWTRPDRMQEVPVTEGTRVVNAFAIGAFLLLLLAALFVSRRNLRAGRGDRRGALQLGAFAVVGQMIAWAFNDPHIANSGIEVQRFFESVGESLFAGGTLYVMYLAVEPAVRRYWPDSLLGWTRLLRGRFIDARVGRDVLVGMAAGAVMQLLISARLSFQALVGSPSLPLSAGNLRFFEGPTYVVGFFTSLLAFQAMFNAMWCIFAIVGLMRLLKRMWLVGIAASLLFAFIAANDIFIGASGATWINFLVALAVVGIIISVAIRVGLLATAAAFLASFVVSATPWTFDPTDWYFPSSALSLLLMCALAVTAGFAARAGASPQVD
jgi:hypothetical protein